MGWNRMVIPTKRIQVCTQGPIFAFSSTADYHVSVLWVSLFWLILKRTSTASHVVYEGFQVEETSNAGRVSVEGSAGELWGVAAVCSLESYFDKLHYSYCFLFPVQYPVRCVLWGITSASTFCSFSSFAGSDGSILMRLSVLEYGLALQRCPQFVCSRTRGWFDSSHHLFRHVKKYERHDVYRLLTWRYHLILSHPVPFCSW